MVDTIRAEEIAILERKVCIRFRRVGVGGRFEADDWTGGHLKVVHFRAWRGHAMGVFRCDRKIVVTARTQVREPPVER